MKSCRRRRLRGQAEDDLIQQLVREAFKGGRHAPNGPWGEQQPQFHMTGCYSAEV